MLQLNKMKERWIRVQAMDQGGMDVTTAGNERAMDPLGKLATESLSKRLKSHIFTCSLLYNSNFVNFVKNDKELNLSSKTAD